LEVMGCAQPWYSVWGVDAPRLAAERHTSGFLRDGDRVFLTYPTTRRGTEPADGSLGLLDMTPYGRREAWEDNPEGWPEAPQAGSPVGGHGAPICWYWRSDADGVATWGPTSRPVPQWTRPGATPVQTLGRQGHHHGRRETGYLTASATPSTMTGSSGLSVVTTQRGSAARLRALRDA